MAVAPDVVAEDHNALLFAGGVAGAGEREVAQGGELRLDPVSQGEFEGAQAI